jgi:hypothetical protein
VLVGADGEPALTRGQHLFHFGVLSGLVVLFQQKVVGLAEVALLCAGHYLGIIEVLVRILGDSLAVLEEGNCERLGQIIPLAHCLKLGHRFYFAALHRRGIMIGHRVDLDLGSVHVVTLRGEAATTNCVRLDV